MGRIPSIRVTGLMALVMAGCASLPASDPVVATPNWPALGSTWAYEERTSGSLGSGVRQVPVKALGEQDWRGQALLAYSEGAVTTYWTARGELMAIMQGDKSLFTYEPSDKLYDWPLQVGKTWVDKGRRTDRARNQTLDFEVDVKVETYEEVMTPAGSFKAFKIVLTSAPLKTQFVNWWSPELGIVVKHTWDRFPGNQFGEGHRDRILISQDIKR